MNVDQCVHCGLCLTACPTYEATGLEMESPRGRLVLLNNWAANANFQSRDAAQWLDDCLDCRACESACPSNIPTGHLVEEWRSTVPLGTANRRLLLGLSQAVGSPRGLKRLQRLIRIGQNPLGRWALSKLGSLLSIATGDVLDGLPPSIHPGLSRESLTTNMPNADTMMFVGCIMDAVYNQSNEHTAALLRLAGHTVTVPSNQVCCGALHRHGGDPATTRRLAKANIKAYEATGAQQVVVNAAGCGTTLKEYPTLFESGSEWHFRAISFSRAVRDVIQTLTERPLAQLTQQSTTITVHDACHHTAQNLNQSTRALLERAGFSIREMPNSTRCCGSAGVYNLTHPSMGRTLAQQKVSDIPPETQIVAAANPGCILQIQAGTRHYGRNTVTVRHPIDLAYDAYRAAGYLGGVADAT